MGAAFFSGNTGAQEPAPDAEPIETPVPAAPAAPGTDATAARQLSAPEMEALIRRVEQSDAYSAEVKGQVLPLYDQALELLRQAATLQERTGQLQTSTETAQARSEELRERLSKPPAPLELSVSVDPTPAEVKTAIAETENRLASAQQQLTELQAEATQRPQRRQQLPQLISEVRGKLAALPPAESLTPGEGEPAQIFEARQTLRRAQRQALEMEAAALETELRSYEVRGNLGLLNQRIDVARREVERAEHLLREYRALETTLERAATEDAQQQLQELRATVEEAAPGLTDFVRSIAQMYTAFESELAGPEGLRGKTRQAEAALEATAGAMQDVSDMRAELEDRLELRGMTQEMAYLLRQKLSTLPNVDARTQVVERRQEELDSLQWRLFDLQNERNNLPNGNQVSDLLGALPPEISESEREAIGAMLRDALLDLRDKFDDVQNELETYFGRLSELNNAEAQLIEATVTVREFIDARILWVKSAPALSLRTFSETLPALRSLLTPGYWGGSLRGMFGHIQSNPFLAGGVISLLLLALLVQPPARRQLQVLGKEAAKTTNTRISDTLRTLLITFALAAPVPGALMTLGWMFWRAQETGAFGLAAGQGLLLAGVVLLTLEVPRQALRAGGLGEAHYNWPAKPQRRLRLQVFTLECLVAPLLFLLGFVERRDNEVWVQSLGRLSFMLAMLLLFYFFAGNMRKGRGPIRQIIDCETTNPRWPRVLFLAALVVPLVLLVMSGIGYHYTAVRLGWKLYITLCVLISLVLVRGVILRWLLLARRRLAMEQARKRREALKAARESGAEGEVVTTEESPLDLSTVNIQSNRMLRAGLIFGSIVALWFIWAEVLPALNFLEEKQLATIAGEDGEQVAITWLDVLMAGLILVLAIAATRNIPGLLEIAVLQRTGLAAGERYAVTTVVRYTIMVLGGVLAFNSLNIGWGKLQWLVAALGLGLGFGLQEIFANFVSGLIILFERPIRVGDVVTMGDVTGTVSRIRMRATTVTDFDRKELIVPNKEFVTGKLINWSLSDTVLRIVIPVGIAYGSDTDKAVSILHEVAEAHPEVLTEPAPIILFDGFGESSLNFELRVYCSGIEHYIPLKHDMHMNIDKAFRNAGIEIAFPQRDLHIRTFKEAVTLRSEGEHAEFADVQPVK